MDQNVKQGNKWPTLKPDEKVNQLRLMRGRAGYGKDWFMKNILDEGLASTYVRQITLGNPYDI